MGYQALKKTMLMDMETFRQSRADTVAKLRQYADSMQFSKRSAETAKLVSNTTGVCGLLTTIAGITCALTPVTAPVAAIMAVGGAITSISSVTTLAIGGISSCSDAWYNDLLKETLRKDQQLMKQLLTNLSSHLDTSSSFSKVICKEALYVLYSTYALGAKGLHLSAEELEKNAERIAQIMDEPCGEMREFWNEEDLEMKLSKLGETDYPGMDYVCEKGGELLERSEIALTKGSEFLEQSGLLEKGSESIVESIFEMAIDGFAPAAAFLAPYTIYKLANTFREHAKDNHAGAATALRSMAQAWEDAGNEVHKQQMKAL